MAGPGTPFANLAVAVGTTLSVVLLGYVLGSLGVCDPQASKGLSQYLTWVAFPALVFHGLATMDLSQLSWTVYSAILVSKIITMLIMVAIVLLMSRAPMGVRLKKAGILGMFVTMTNDVAIGLPIVQAVYPQFASYLYLPQQYLLFNPLALVLLELGVAYDAKAAVAPGEAEAVKATPVPLKLLRGVLTNHILLVSFVGLGCNFLFHGRLPTFLNNVTNFIGQSFAPGAIFSVGMAMVGKGQVLQGRGLIWPAMITFIKIVVTANVGRYFAVLVDPQWEPFHNFLFVYGCLPVGVPCFLFAIQYGAFPEIVSGGLVLALLCSGPAIAIAVIFSDLKGSIGSLVTIEEVLNGVSGAAALLLVIVLVGRRVYHDVAEGLLLHLAATTLASCGAYQLCAAFFCPDASHDRRRFPLPFLAHQFFRQQVEVVYVAVAVCLAVHLRRGLAKARTLLAQYLLSAWVLPFGFVALLALADAVQDHDLSCWISYGMFQVVAELVILSLESLVVLVCFVFILRTRTASPDVASVALLAEDEAAAAAAPTPEHVFRVCLLLGFFLLFALLKLIWLAFSSLNMEEAEPVEALQRLLVALLGHAHGLLQFCLFALYSEESQDWWAGVVGAVRGRLRRWLYHTEEVQPDDSVTGRRPSERQLQLFDDLVAPQSGLVGNRVWRDRIYYGVVQGSEVVDWMVRTGWAEDRATAVALGQTLLRAGLLHHVTLEHNFHDKPFFYHADVGTRQQCVRSRASTRVEEVGPAPSTVDPPAVLPSLVEKALPAP
eukprot:EG_transcript_3559